MTDREEALKWLDKAEISLEREMPSQGVIDTFRKALQAKEPEYGVSPAVTGTIDALRTENARLREALVDISHGCLVPPDGGSPTFDDLVDCARNALAPQIEGK